MSFSISDNGGWGSGALGDVSNPSGLINSYARTGLYNYSEDKGIVLTVQKLSIINGIYHTIDENFTGEILLHVMTHQSGTSDITHCGRFWFASITGCCDSNDTYFYFTVDKDFTDIKDLDNNFYLQMITVPHFDSLTLSTVNLQPAPISKFTTDSNEFFGAGGVLVFKCKTSLTLEGGHIDLAGRGLTNDYSDSRRKLLPHEEQATLDTDLYAGCENSITKDHLILNRGDGACLIIAKNISTQSSSRIGSTSLRGVQYCRGASDSPNCPANASNIGGSSILIAADRWNSFVPANISKYRDTSKASVSSPRGLARAYLAIGNLWSNHIHDEGLYALDCLKNSARVHSKTGISSFGAGYKILTVTSSTKCFNAYAAVQYIDGDTVGIGSVIPDGIWEKGFNGVSLVMIHRTLKSSEDTYDDGEFFIARVVAANTGSLVLKRPVPFDYEPSRFYYQVVNIPQFTKFTLNKSYEATPAWSNGVGGICALACSDTCNLSGGTIDLDKKGTFRNVVNKRIGNVYMKSRLPIGQGTGSLFILAKNLIMNTSTRLGGTWNGSVFGGRAVKSSSLAYTAYGGYRGVDGYCTDGDGKYDSYKGLGGWGGGGGAQANGYVGGWHSNSPHASSEYRGGFQGAHIFIAADTITGFNLNALSTGGKGGGILGAYTANPEVDCAGGAGYGGAGYCVRNGTTIERYGGAGGYCGGGGAVTPTNTGALRSGGGGSGFAFVYCNEFVNQNTTGIITI